MFGIRHTSRFALFLGLTVALLQSSALVAGDSAWYLQGKLGDIDLNTRLGSTWSKQINGNDEAASVEVGYGAHRYLAFQAGYHDLGAHPGGGSPCPQDAEICVLEDSAVRAELNGLSLAAVPRLPFNDRWSAFGKLGVMDWQSDVALAEPGAGNRRIESFDDRELLTGIGVQYQLPKGLGLVLERQSFDLTGGWITLGASWRF